MKLSLGIVGLPNVGKSTLFNALTNNNVAAENYPFCTIDPNVGIVAVMDPRLDKLAELVKPEKVTPAVIEFWDIAGLVKGAAQGEGLGNQFLANIRSVSAIVHVVRAFKDSNVTHVENFVDVKRDIELINAELILKDLETVESKRGVLAGKAREKAENRPQFEWLERLKTHLEEGKLAYDFKDSASDQKINELRQSLFLLTDKPVLYLVNVEESQAEAAVNLVRSVAGENAQVLALDNKMEFEISQLPLAERAEYLKELGLGEPGLAKLTRSCYALLGLISYFTAGEKEVRAWTIAKDTLAPQAAGEIHTDFIKKFIAADVCKFEDFVATGGWNEAKAKGKMRLEGKDYVVKDGDVITFRIGA